jgi:hypothetical protein
MVITLMIAKCLRPFYLFIIISYTYIPNILSQYPLMKTDKYDENYWYLEVLYHRFTIQTTQRVYNDYYFNDR